MSTERQREFFKHEQLQRMKRRCRPGQLTAEDHHLNMHREMDRHNVEHGKRIEGHLLIERRVWQKILALLEKPQPSFLARLFGRNA